MNRNFGGSARVVNALLGIWLFLSAFVWPHDSAQRTDTWILGILAVVFSFVAMRVPAARFANTVLAIWLFVSAFALHHAVAGTVWNNAIVAVAIFFLSLVPGRDAASQMELPAAERPISPPQQPRTV